MGRRDGPSEKRVIWHALFGLDNTRNVLPDRLPSPSRGTLRRPTTPDRVAGSSEKRHDRHGFFRRDNTRNVGWGEKPQGPARAAGALGYKTVKAVMPG